MSVGTTDAAVVHRRATAFFLGWLILAASMSLAGNVGHALLIAPVEMGWLAGQSLTGFQKKIHSLPKW